MVVGILRLELMIPEAMSLKDKRRAVKSLKDRLAHRHNISIAEVDRLDEHRMSEMGIAMVSNDARFVQSCLDKIVDEVRLARQVGLVDYDIEIL